MVAGLVPKWSNRYLGGARASQLIQMGGEIIQFSGDTSVILKVPLVTPWGPIDLT